MNRKTYWLFLSILLALPIWALGAEILFPVDGKFVLPISAGAKMLNQCSRAAPQNTNGFWLPSIDQVEKIDNKLDNLIIERKKIGARLPATGSYHRQYIGFIKDQHKYIYINFYKKDEYINHEKSIPVMVCDGGSSFWGIVFNLDTGLFDEPKFNGVG